MQNAVTKDSPRLAESWIQQALGRCDTAGTWQMHLCMGCGHRQKGQLIKAAEV